ncbi:Lrp/AsnC family transcriptional regulator [Paenibacillus amylolyticus]|uniref:Transcriptional regulator, AraC family n=1 Tax=Paenibacillus amylolyticus TaxID=1451 RepID=A0A124DY57_PAEAM|nr:Lrp/AsnC family transcriptional regulator [Paenibacillus amylolyticus]GAS83160.1 transcriptional regulator, AraC family [Paenibacillus amylolyticus]
MNNIDKDIIMHLQEDARLTMTSIGKLIGLSQPAVTERVKRLEEQGVITGYRALVSNEKVGKPMTAFLLFRTNQCLEFVDYCEKSPQVMECYRVSGEHNYLIKVIVESTKELELFENESIMYGNFTTVITLSSPIENKPLLPSGDVTHD